MGPAGQDLVLELEVGGQRLARLAAVDRLAHADLAEGQLAVLAVIEERGGVSDDLDPYRPHSRTLESRPLSTVSELSEFANHTPWGELADRRGAARTGALPVRAATGRSGRADPPGGLLAEADRDGQLLGAAQHAQLEGLALAGLVERLVELVGVGDRLAAGLHEQVAGAQARPVGRAVFLDHPHQQAVPLGKTDRPAELPGHSGRRDADPEPRAGGGLAAAERLQPPAQLGVGRQGEVEAVAE